MLTIRTQLEQYLATGRGEDAKDDEEIEEGYCDETTSPPRMKAAPIIIHNVITSANTKWATSKPRINVTLLQRNALFKGMKDSTMDGVETKNSNSAGKTF